MCTKPGTVHTALHVEEHELDEYEEIAQRLQETAGRFIVNGWPTGVAVTWAMQHGGPWPSTTNPLHTSVGSSAIRCFLRPVAFQGTPERLLPSALRDTNPLGIPRRVDGRLVLPDSDLG